MADKLYGWKGKMLWIDLAAKTGKDLDISDLCEKYIGGRGIASKLAWDYIKPGTGAFDDGNLLMFMNGPVAGSLLPGAGRGYVFAVAPQSYPEHFSRSSIGGRWATELKACGYDGIILANKADDKTVLEINDNGVVFHDGNPYWGQDTHVTQEKLKEQFGEDMDAVCIGQAGERLIRIATVQTLVNNAAGQGGFGAVMGDKKVKAIVFKGTQPTYVADMAKVDQLRREIFSTAFGYTEGGSLADQPADIGLIPGNMFKADQLIAEGSMTSVNNKYAACRGCGLGGYSCVSGYAGQWSYKDVPAVHDKRTMSGAYKCAEQVALGWVTETTDLDRQWVKTGTGRKYRWPANFRAGVEIIDMWNRYGLNGWELGSMMIWLSELDSIGVDLPALTGMDDFDMSDPTIFQRCLIKLVEREPGFFYDLGEGLARIGAKLGDGYREYTTHALNGYCDHALGTRCYYNHTYPTWVAPALMWATDNRDPFSDVGHRYYEISFTFKRKDLAKKLWGDELTIGPDENLRSINGGDMEDDVFDDLAYSMKEYPAVQCQNRGVVTGSGIFCDGVYPNYGAKIFDGREGDFDLEAKVLTAVTGVEYTTEGLEKFGDRIVNMERCYNILEWGRNKEYDMLICDNIQPRGDWSTGKRIDKERFSKLLGRFYALRGWDEDGVPTEEKLLELGLEECNEMMKPFRK